MVAPLSEARLPSSSSYFRTTTRKLSPCGKMYLHKKQTDVSRAPFCFPTMQLSLTSLPVTSSSSILGEMRRKNICPTSFLFLTKRMVGPVNSLGLSQPLVFHSLHITPNAPDTDCRSGLKRPVLPERLAGWGVRGEASHWSTAASL